MNLREKNKLSKREVKKVVVAWLLKENPSWSWRDAMNYVWKSRQILPAVEISESILDYFESIEGHRRNY